VYANSIVAVDAKTGKYMWHFQTVHHDLWDTDMPSAGALFDFVQNGTPWRSGWHLSSDRRRAPYAGSRPPANVPTGYLADPTDRARRRDARG